MRFKFVRALIAVSIAVATPVAAQTVQVFDVPKGAKPHDVSPGAGGMVWYTAQGQGALGILDPKTGKVEQVSLGEGSAPHGVIMGPDGAAWITDSGLNAIVRWDPVTRRQKNWVLPQDTGYANLNTAAFDGDGVLWFTGQSGFYGKVDPKADSISVWPSPKGRGPYGIDATPDGEIYYVSLAGSHLAKIDRATGEAKMIDHPAAGQGARRVWSDSKGVLWVSEWNTGYLARHTPSTGEWTRWKLPGEKPLAYAVYVDENDMVWVSDWGANATLAFDPKSETFTASIPGSKPGANVRQILGRKGEVWLPESAHDRLMLVRTDR
jgi:virginiamycin B lyase